MSSGVAKAVQRLRHIRDAAEKVASYCSLGRDSFERDEVLRDAILYQIIVIGEAAKALVRADSALAGSVTDVNWSALAKMRDLLTHQYWSTDRNIVWDTATVDIPRIRQAVVAALERVK